MAVAGMFFGYLFTGIFYFINDTKYGLDGIARLLSDHYVSSLPFFIAACIICFPLSGLYAYNSGTTIIRRVRIIAQAVGLAFLIFIFEIYLFQQTSGPKYFMLPRSSMLFGWLAVLILMMAVRIGRAIFYRAYIVLPRSGTVENSDYAKFLRAFERESGWVSAETAAASRDRGKSISARFTMWPYFDEEMIAQVSTVLRSGKVNKWTGEQNELFEREFAGYVTREYAIAVSNGTVALELALRALNIGPGDEVIVPCRTFIASASCVVMQGAIPVMADIDRTSQNLTAETIEKAITDHTKAIIVVHLNGWPCDMDPILALAHEHGIKVIEDCAQAHGATYQNRPVGSMGDVAAFSFCQDKIMTTGGEGGMVTTNDPELWQKAWSLRDHGKNLTKLQTGPGTPEFKWLHDDFGTNWRMTEIQAIIGRMALKLLPGWVETRRKYAKMLTEAFSEINGLRVTIPPDNARHSYYKYYVFLEPEKLKEDWNRERVMTAISAEGIPCFAGICGQIFREEAFVKHNLVPKTELPVSEELMNTSLMFLVHPTLMTQNIKDTISAVQKVMSQATQSP